MLWEVMEMARKRKAEYFYNLCNKCRHQHDTIHEPWKVCPKCGSDDIVTFNWQCRPPDFHKAKPLISIEDLTPAEMEEAYRQGQRKKQEQVEISARSKKQRPILEGWIKDFTTKEKEIILSLLEARTDGQRAEFLGISKQNFRQRKKRAIAKLTKKLKELGIKSYKDLRIIW